MTHLVLSELSQTYSNTNKPALDRLNLDIESGQLNALLGPSGCGKTTAMKMIAGILTPTSGDILFDGKSVLPIPAERRGAVMVFQNYLLFPYMTVGDNVGFGLKMARVDKKIIEKKVLEMLELVQLPGVQNRKPSQLSGGQQQRIALARALIVEPKVLLLDEPLSNLDAHLRDEMRELIRDIQEKMGITTVFVTHDQEEAVMLADKIALIFDGVLQQYDIPEVFYNQPGSLRAAKFFGGVNFVEGSYASGEITTNIGKFEAPRSSNKGGAGVLSIRPEDIEFGVPEKGANTVSGSVKSHVYVGTYTKYKIKCQDHEFEVIADASSKNSYPDNSNVNLRFPAEKIWVLPKD